MSRVVLIDSGVGGITLVQAIQEKFPELHIGYGNDNAQFPYGPKPEKQVAELVLQFVLKLLQHTEADAVIVGCNTASTVALPTLRETLPIPVIGVVPAIKPAAALSETGHIGLLATEGTVQRSYTKELIQHFAAHCQVHSVGSNELVQMAEDHVRGRAIDRVRLKEILSPFVVNPVDVLVLGCTHFPLLATLIQEELGEKVALVDSGEAIARRTGQILGIDEQPGEKPTGTLAAYFSKDGEELASLWPFLDGIGFEKVEVLSLGN